MDLLPATFSYEPIRAGQTFRVGGHEIEVQHVPGHTLGMVALRLDDRCLFTGDSIFIRSVSRPDLGGKADVWAPLHFRSLRRLLDLSDQITILPGHFSGMDEADETGRFQATLGHLKRQNESLVVLQREGDAGFVRYLIESLPKFIPQYVDIKRVNTGLLSPTEDDAAALELGKIYAHCRRRTPPLEENVMGLQFDKVFDARGMNCPMPLVNARKEVGKIHPGQILKVLATDRGSVADFQGWTKVAKNVELIGQGHRVCGWRERIRALHQTNGIGASTWRQSPR